MSNRKLWALTTLTIALAIGLTMLVFANRPPTSAIAPVTVYTLAMIFAATSKQ